MARAVEIDSNQLDWVPTKWPGIARKLLRNDATTGARTVLLKFDANTRLPRHMHPAGEEVFVLEGRVRFDETWYDAGFYLYSPPGSADDVFTDTGAILFVALPNERSAQMSTGRRRPLSRSRGTIQAGAGLDDAYRSR